MTERMSYARSYHTSSVLRSGKVLVAGGNGHNGALNTSELYDPATETWTNTAAMNYQRIQHTASTLLNGKILVAGGYVSYINRLVR